MAKKSSPESRQEFPSPSKFASGGPDCRANGDMMRSRLSALHHPFPSISHSTIPIAPRYYCTFFYFHFFFVSYQKATKTNRGPTSVQLFASLDPRQELGVVINLNYPYLPHTNYRVPPLALIPCIMSSRIWMNSLRTCLLRI